MGRTTRTFREAVDIESAKWKTFRRQLKPDDREKFDRIFNYARMHADSATVISIPHKIDVVFMSVLIEMQRRIEELESVIEQYDTSVCEELTGVIHLLALHPHSD